MSIAESLPVTAQDYDRAAEEFYLNLPLEHFMKATPQATQREITLESFALLKTRRGDVQYFSELLVQYIFQGQLRRIVPDNILRQLSASTNAKQLEKWLEELHPTASE